MNESIKNKLVLSLRSKKSNNFNIIPREEKMESCMLNNKCQLLKKIKCIKK